MFTKTLIIIMLFIVALGAFLFFSSETEHQNLVPEFVQEVVTPNYESVPLATQVGQLFALGHWPHIPLEETTRRVSEHQLGSVIVMAAPSDEQEIEDWTTTWQSSSSIPLLITIDQEGGIVSRLKGRDHLQTAQSTITTESQAYDIASERAAALSTLGINGNYAPVLDQSISPDSFMYPRVFRAPDMIATLGDAMVRGYQDNGVIAVPKHFPGHPDTSDDSHITLPRLDLTFNEYIDHTKQFTDIVANGNVHMLMTAHVLVSAIDEEYPATVSPLVIGDLRTRINYDGVIITDDLAMQAISDTWDHPQAAVRALQAGVDVVMLAAEPEHIDETVTAVIKAVETGELSRERVFEAYNRVMEMKESL